MTPREASIDADQAIYSQLDDEPEPEPINAHPPEQLLLVRRLLDLLFDCECLSVKGRVLTAWIRENGGQPIYAHQGIVRRITQRLYQSQAHWVNQYIVEISNDPVLGRYFKYFPRARKHSNQLNQRE